MEFDLRPRKLDIYIVAKFISTFFVALLLIIGIVIIFDDAIHIYFKTPLPTGPDESQGFSFYHKTLKFAYKVCQRRDIKKFEIKLEIRV